MKPIYFPFTFISEPVLKDISIFFPQIVIYQPSSEKIPEYLKKSADEGLLEIHAPFGGDETRFDNLVREYRQWVEHHRGSETTFFKTRIFDSIDIETVPMYSDNSTSQIKYEIKKGHVGKQPQKPDEEFTARLFLLIAQQFDIQQYEFKKDLQHFKIMENNFFSNIRDENESSETNIKNLNTVIVDDVGSNKTGQRLSAWLKIFEHDPVAPDEFGSGLFITSSHSVLEYIMELCPESELVLSTGPVSANDRHPEKNKEFQELLKENLRRLSENQFDKDLTPFPDTTATNNDSLVLNIFCLSRTSLLTLFKEKVKQPDSVPQDNRALNFQKIFIGIVERVQQ
jgi:hypothetical protein